MRKIVIILTVHNAPLLIHIHVCFCNFLLYSLVICFITWLKVESAFVFSCYLSWFLCLFFKCRVINSDSISFFHFLFCNHVYITSSIIPFETPVCLHILWFLFSCLLILYSCKFWQFFPNVIPKFFDWRVRTIVDKYSSSFIFILSMSTLWGKVYALSPAFLRDVVQIFKFFFLLSNLRKVMNISQLKLSPASLLSDFCLKDYFL